MKIIAEIVTLSAFIQKLNISQNNLLPNDFSDLLESLKANKVIKNCDLSNNLLLDAKDQKEKGDIAHLLLNKLSRW